MRQLKMTIWFQHAYLEHCQHVTTWGQEKLTPELWKPFDIFPSLYMTRVITLQVLLPALRGDMAALPLPPDVHPANPSSPCHSLVS